MATFIISTNSVGAGPQFTYTGANDNLAILQGVTLGSTSGSALAGLGFANLTLSLLGTLISTNEINFSGAAAAISIASGASFISYEPTAGNVGFFLSGTAGRLENHGSISAERSIGIATNGGDSIINTGRIDAATPIFMGLFGAAGDQFVNSGHVAANAVADDVSNQRFNNGVMAEGADTRVSNLAGGTITATSSEGAGVSFRSNATGSSLDNAGEIVSQRWYGVDYGNVTVSTGLSLHNTGTISGALGSFRGHANPDIIFNLGVMNGLISLGGGADLYDGAGGKFLGVVSGGTGNDTVIGGVFDEAILGGGDNDRLEGRGGNDTLNGGDGNDSAWGGDGIDSLIGGGSNDYLDGQGEDDEVYGGDNNDTLFGNHGNDYLDGQGENDLIFGGDGNDIIRGNIGQDQMVGGAGSDTMTGGVGDDQFRFFASDLENGRRDVITDFAEAGGNADLLVFFDGLQASNITTSQAGGDVIVRITYAGGTAVHEIVVENFLVAQLADQMFFL